jgi:3-deoxy-D-manno-octulosonate 8-phosphate phosphatase (KDO 8-P phosphatase)
MRYARYPGPEKILILMSIADLSQIKSVFTGSFLTEPAALQQKLFKVKAYVFDWDGVFNNGTKDASGSSPFNEVDSMGLNMLRFNHYLRKNVNPVTAVITGENNSAAFTLAKREHFHSVYSGAKNKKDALLHLCDAYGLEPHEVAFFFDDVLDLSVAGLCGLRILIGRQGSPLFADLVLQNKFADYITANDGGSNGLREAAELLIGLVGNYDDTIMQRVHYTEHYEKYIYTRNEPEPVFYTITDSKITEQPGK